MWGSSDWPERIAAWFVRHGVPASDVRRPDRARATRSRPFIRYALDPELLHEGSDARTAGTSSSCPATPTATSASCATASSSPATTCSTKISPAVGLYPESRPDPLGDYLASLERTIELAPRIVYPGHGEPIDDPPPRGRASSSSTTAQRLDETAAALAPGAASTAYEVSLHVCSATSSPPTQRRFAVAETLSHLERLVRRGPGRARR